MWPYVKNLAKQKSGQLKYSELQLMLMKESSSVCLLNVSLKSKHSLDWELVLFWIPLYPNTSGIMRHLSSAQTIALAFDWTGDAAMGAICPYSQYLQWATESGGSRVSGVLPGPAAVEPAREFNRGHDQSLPCWGNIYPASPAKHSQRYHWKAAQF